MLMKYKITENLCEQQSSLTDSDIKIIIETSKAAEYITQIETCDVFIDIKSNIENSALVVFESRPSDGQSLYKNSVVGELALRVNEPGVLRSLELGIHTKNIHAKTQENIWVKQNVIPIKNGEKTIAVLITERNISKEILTDEKIKSLSDDNEVLTSTLMTLLNYENDFKDEMKEAILIFNSEGKLVLKNKSADNIYEKLGFFESLNELDYNNLRFDEITLTEINGINPKEYKNFLLHKKVTIGNNYFEVKKIVTDNSENKIIMIINDLTEIKNKDDEIISKSVAIREIHHRVKNNLQTIASLLRLQSRNCIGDEAKLALLESGNRILSIATTHELLSKQIEDNISIIEVLSTIKNNMLRCFSNSNKVSIDISGDDFIVNSDKSTTIALIVNELFQNSMEHAFIGRDKGSIKLILESIGEYKIVKVIDDGIGFDINDTRKDSLGSKIVSSYVKDKLKGNLIIDSNRSGTSIIIKFIV